jgi:hypothetical protein
MLSPVFRLLAQADRVIVLAALNDPILNRISFSISGLAVNAAGFRICASRFVREAALRALPGHDEQ